MYIYDSSKLQQLFENIYFRPLTLARLSKDYSWGEDFNLYMNENYTTTSHQPCRKWEWLLTFFGWTASLIIFWQGHILIFQPLSIIIQLEITENNIVELFVVRHQPNDKQHIHYEFPITGSVNKFNFVRWPAWYKAIKSDIPIAKIVMYVEKSVLSDTP